MKSSSVPDALPLRWGLILLFAAVIGVVVGGLTLLQTASWPAALLAALGSAGAAIIGGHEIVAGG